MKKIVCLVGCLVFGLCGSLFSGCLNGEKLTPKEHVELFVNFELPSDIELEYNYTIFSIFKCKEEPTEMLKNFAPPSEFDKDGVDLFAYHFLERLGVVGGEKIPKTMYPDFNENYLCYQSFSGKIKNGDTRGANMMLVYSPQNKKIYTLGGWN